MVCIGLIRNIQARLLASHSLFEVLAAVTELQL